jgi:hypothetical protein
LASLVKRKSKGRRRGVVGSAAEAAGRRGREGGEERKGGEGEADRWGPSVSESREKEKRERRAGAGRSKWAGWPCWAERREGKVFLFFFFSFFKLLFKTTFLFKFKSKLFQPFLKNL